MKWFMRDEVLVALMVVAGGNVALALVGENWTAALGWFVAATLYHLLRDGDRSAFDRGHADGYSERERDERLERRNGRRPGRYYPSP